MKKLIVAEAGLVCALSIVTYVLGLVPFAVRRDNSVPFGELNIDAVAQTTGFQDFPVAWLGEDFQGYKLTSVERDKYVMPVNVNIDRFTLVYGSCDIASRDGSCAPPLAISFSPPGYISPIGPIAPERALSNVEAIGETGRWKADGIVIQFEPDQIALPDVLNALRPANSSTSP
jgi:hypothetical protein